VALAVLAVGWPAVRLAAQTQRSGGGASQGMVQQLQQLTSEKSALTAENAKLKRDLDDAKAALAKAGKERDALSAKVGSADANVQRADAATKSAEASLEQTKRKLEELIKRFREVATTLHDVESSRAELQGQLALRSHEYEMCVERAVALYDVNKEILDRWEHEGAFERATLIDGFTRLKRTQLENLIDEYRARADELRLQEQKSAPAAAEREPRTP
jgi:DNA repair exonuclease SbcCD ATPase subunit